MRVSFRWLGRHVDLSGITPEQLRADLTLSTCEVEGLERWAPHLSDVTVGFVVERGKHPDADHLSVCKVDVAAGELLQIVCGAPNVAAGQKVAVATVGTTLPGDLKIKKSKIRGVESQGMICSERELDLGDEHSGIWVLPEDAQVGARVAEALDLADWVIEIDNKSITHRPDLWGHRGMAQEAAAIYSRKLSPLDVSLPATGDGRPYPVRIESPDCSRYFALPIDGVRGGRSPDWMRRLLLAVGQRPIDLLVDLSNFVMLDLGQPNHVFDRARLAGEPIVVRKARLAERLTTLDGVERRLEPADLLICAGEAPVALAGIMGGAESKIAEGTESLLLECATFQPAVVRRTASRLALRTDSSARFEKNLDPLLAPRAAGHFARLLAQLVPGVRFPAPPTDVGAWKDPSRSIRLRPEVVRCKLGADLQDAEIGSILERLAFGVAWKDGSFDVRVPSIRATKDISIEQDLVEEVGRIYRYGNVPERALEGRIEPPPPDARRALVRRVEDRLAGGARYRQTISYSFVADDLLAKLGQLDAPHVAVVNPVAEGLSRIRRSVLPSLLPLLAPNRRNIGEVRLFEIGKGYLPEHQHGAGEPAEVHELALALAAAPPAKGARFDAGALSRLQSDVEALHRHLLLEAPVWNRGQGPDLPAWAHPGRSLAARGEGGATIWLAEIEPGLARELGLAGELASDVALAVVPIDALLAARPRKRIYEPLPRFPGVKVDVALAVPERTPAAEVRAAIERAGKGLVATTELFDVYAGEKLGPGRKSLAWHVLLQAENRTLNDQDGQKFLQRLEREASQLGGELRRE